MWFPHQHRNRVKIKILSFPVFIFGVIYLFSSAEPQTRKQSLDDINLDQFLKIANYEDTVKELDIYYGIGRLRYVCQMN